MIKVKTEELYGPTLDWAVANARQMNVTIGKYYLDHVIYLAPFQGEEYAPSIRFEVAAPYLEEYTIDTDGNPARAKHLKWRAVMDSRIHKGQRVSAFGPTLLMAAMRCLVTALLGETIKVPKELLVNQKK